MATATSTPGARVVFPTWAARHSWVLLPLLAVLWCAGLHVVDGARALVLLGLLGLVRQRRGVGDTGPEVRWPAWPLVLVATGTLVIMVVGSLARVDLGRHGVDEVIFSQAATSLARTGRFWVTHNRGDVNDFLADHFSPALAVPGAMILLGVSPRAAMILAQGLALLGSLAALVALGRRLGWSLAVAAFTALLWLSLGDIREQVYWGTQSEYLALPLVILACERRLAGRAWQAVACAVLACLAKETLMAWAAAFSLFACLREGRLSSPWVLLAAVGTTGFFGYAFGHEWLFGEPYGYRSRIDLLQVIAEPQVLGQRLLYLGHFFLPVLFWPFGARRRLVYIVPVLPWLAMAMISNFADMYQMGRQYVTLPMTVVFVSCLEGAASEGAGRALTWPSLALLTGMAFAWGGHKPAQDLWHWLKAPQLLRQEDLPAMGHGGRVFTTPAAAMFLLDRLDQRPLTVGDPAWRAGDEALVMGTEGLGALPPSMAAVARSCGGQGAWLRFCAP